MPRPRNPRLAEVERRRQNQIRDRTGATLTALLAALPDLSEQALADYQAAAYPTVLGGQTLAAGTAAGYVTALAPPSESSRRRRRLDVAAALARSGVLVTPETRSLIFPVLRARSLVNDGQTHAAAVAAAGSYAGALSGNDVMAAQRVGLDEAADSAGTRIVGWRKETGGNACPWCEETAGGFYHSADAVPFHDRDQCSVAPIFEGDE